MKLSCWPRIRHTVLRSGSVDATSGWLSLCSNGPLSKRAIVGVVKSTLHSTLVSFVFHTTRQEHLLVCFSAYSISVAVYVLLSVTQMPPTLAHAKKSAIYFSQLPLMIPILSLGLTPSFSNALASKLDSSHSCWYVHRAPVQGMTTASFSG